MLREAGGQFRTLLEIGWRLAISRRCGSPGRWSFRFGGNAVDRQADAEEGDAAHEEIGGSLAEGRFRVIRLELREDLNEGLRRELDLVAGEAA